MDPHRSKANNDLGNRLKEMLLEQKGSPSLILNDFLMGDEGAKIFYELVPIHHQSSLRHLEIKGNNISSLGFEMICTALLGTSLKNLQAQWNIIGLGSTVGLNSLVKLVRNTPTLENIDLKNNRIDHVTVEPICELIRLNLSWLKVLDLRWNELGELGGRALLGALSQNTFIKTLELGNNRISEATLMAITEYLLAANRKNVESINKFSSLPATQFPFSQDMYPDMGTQTRLSQFRSKIQTQQKQSMIYRDKMEHEINGVIQSMKIKSTCLQQAKLRLQGLLAEQLNLKSQIAQAQRMFLNYRESTSKIGLQLNVQQADYRRGKYNLNRQSQQLTKNLIDKQEAEVGLLNQDMFRKVSYLAGILSEKLQRKKQSRDKLLSLQQDYLKFKIEREGQEHNISSRVAENERRRYEDAFKKVTERVKEDQGQVGALKRKNEYLNSELTQCVLRGLQRVKKLEGQIFNLQQKVKKMHDEMTKINLDIDSQATKLELVSANVEQKEKFARVLHQQTTNLISQGNVLLDMVRQNQTQERKALAHSNQMLYNRLLQLEKAIRAQESSNNIVKNHYDKLCNLLQTQAQNAIFYTMVGGVGNP